MENVLSCEYPVILPAFNQANRVPPVLAGFSGIMSIIVADHDDGVTIARVSGVEGLSNERNEGKGAALNAYTRKKGTGHKEPQ